MELSYKRESQGIGTIQLMYETGHHHLQAPRMNLHLLVKNTVLMLLIMEVGFTLMTVLLLQSL